MEIMLWIALEKMIDNEHKNEDDFTFDDCAQLESLDGIDHLLYKATPIKGYERFYKLSFTMPYL